MSPELSRLKEELLQLSEPERTELAQFLLASLGVSINRRDEAAFVAELDRRASEMESGADPGEEATIVIAELWKRFS